MESITVRPLTRSDLRKILSLLKTRDELTAEGAELRLHLFEHLAFKNPYANGEATYFVAEEKGQIIGHLGRMPTEFVIRGKRQKGYFVHDLYVHPDYRKRGKGFFITNSLYRAVEEHSDSFCCLVWTTDLNLAIQRRRGYHEMCADRYFKFFNPYPKMKKLIKWQWLAKSTAGALKIGLGIFDFFLMHAGPRSDLVSKIHRFDDRFDSLVQKVISNIEVTQFRNSAFLNWRFLDGPPRNIEVLSVERDEEVSGYIALARIPGSEYPELEIVDIMADPEDHRTLSALCRAAIMRSKHQNVCSIKCCLTDERFANVLKKFLFFKDWTAGEPIMLANLHKCDFKELLLNIKSWHLTYGASDELMLEV